MSHKIYRHSRIAIDFLFKRKYHHHAVDTPFDDAYSSRAPSPNLRTDKIADRNANLFKTPSHSKMRARRIDENRQGGVAALGFALQTILHGNYRWNFVKHFRDADDCNFVVVSDKLDARRSHARTAHSEELRSGARAQSSSEPRSIHVTRCFPGRDQNIFFSHGKHERSGVSRSRWC